MKFFQRSYRHPLVFHFGISSLVFLLFTIGCGSQNPRGNQKNIITTRTDSGDPGLAPVIRFSGESFELDLDEAKARLLENILPPPDADPDTQYRPLSSAFPDPTELLTTGDIAQAFQKLREVSSYTKDFHQELSDLITKAASVDAPHLGLVVDGCYFPFEAYAAMKVIVDDPKACQGVPVGPCLQRLERIRKNMARALDYGPVTNRLLAEGITQVRTLDPDQARALVLRLYPLSSPLAATDDAENFFSVALSLLDPLAPEQKLVWIDLAIFKKASMAAVRVGSDWFIKDSDKQVQTLLRLLSAIPSPDARDLLLERTLPVLDRVTHEEAKAIFSAAGKPEKITKILFEKMGPLTASEFSEILSVIQDPARRDVVLLQALPLLKGVDAEGSQALIRLADQEKTRVAQTLLPLISGLSATDLAAIAGFSSYGTARDRILMDNLPLVTSVNVPGLQALALQASAVKAELVMALLPKLPPLSASDLAVVASSVNYGPDRDRVLTAGLSQVTNTDVAGATAVLKQAYEQQISVLSTLFTKFSAMSTTDLAAIVMESPEGRIRDALLLAGVASVTDPSVEGMRAMVNQADQEKIRVALAILPKAVNLDAAELALIISVTVDGRIRDAILKDGVVFLKKADGAGVAKLVQAASERKVQTALAAIALIVEFSGSDLVQILKVCGSGMVRDPILAGAIPSLKNLTKEDARTVFSLAYTNKEEVAVQLMSKVSVIDGQTIADIAQFSMKGSTRDRIILEGMKRLKTLDAKGMIALIKVCYKILDQIIALAAPMVKDLTAEGAIEIALVISDPRSRDIFLIQAVDLVNNLDEPGITLLAVAASTRAAKDEIVRKGLEKIGWLI